MTSAVGGWSQPSHPLLLLAHKLVPQFNLGQLSGECFLTPLNVSFYTLGEYTFFPPSFYINGVELACVPHLRYLGVWLDTSLTWREHIRQVSQRALARLHLIS